MSNRMRFLVPVLFVIGLSLTNASGAVDSNLVGWWPLDDGEGTIAMEASGRGVDGLLNGEPVWSDTGVHGGSLEFDGVDDYIFIDGQYNLPVYTITIWFRVDAPGQQDLISAYAVGVQHGILLELTADGTLRYLHRFPLGTGGGTNFFTTETFDDIDGNWNHAALVKSPDLITLYVNGENVGSAPDNSAFDPTDAFGVALGTLDNERGLQRMFNGAMDDVRIYDRDLSQQEIQLALESTDEPGRSRSPLPAHEAVDVLRDLTLNWTSGIYAVAHDVYFGTSFADVNEASRANPGDVLVSQGQTTTTYVPDNRLALGQTYFWRIDEVNAAPDNSIHKGTVWSFSVEPVSYALAGSSITATASSSLGDDPNAPSRTIDGSGLDDNDGHSSSTNDMWLSASPDADAWIQYEFDGVYKLDRMLVWNGNQLAESAVGWGLKDVQIETSLDGTTWSVVEGITQLTQAVGAPGAGPSDDITLAGIPAQYVRISITNNWGGLLPQYNLSEVRFYYIPVQAREPDPASGTADVLPNAVLGWRAGREAGTHDVLVATDANAVLDGSATATTVADNSFDLASLDLAIGETYYWKVNEVNDSEDPSTWEGPLWNFVIPDPLVVDDFEDYGNDSPDRPFQTWIDGLGYTADDVSPGDPGNNSGAVVGHDIWSPGSPYFDGELMEQVLIHGGTQSLPLYYDNSGAGGKETYSEMTRTFSPAQDWSGNGIATLTLYFRGMAGNGGQLYVKINNTKILFTDDPGAISRSLWEQWNIDLASTGANLSSIQSLSIGIENAGSGLVLIDDVLLYRNAPAVAQGTDPGNAGLVASYSMENTVDDGTGNYNGTATGNPGYEAGLNGMALVFDGVEDYVDLPIGSAIASQPDMTVTSWVKFANNGGAWQRIFDFGSDTTTYMFLTPSMNVSGPIRFAILNPDVEGESLVDGLVAVPAGDWHHVAVSIDSSTMTITLYMDGSVVGSGSTELLPQDLGETTQNWLGRSQWEADAFFEGSLDDVFIYDRVLSEAEIRYLAGEQ